MENNDFKIDISKDFSAPVEKLYNAWTEPEQLKHWWKPMQKDLREVINNLQEGGIVKYVFEDNSLIIEGEYIEVKDKEKLVYTWNWQLPKDAIKDSNYKLSIDFSEENNKSNIHIVQENFESEEGTLIHKEGWEKGLNDLEKYLSNH